MTVQNNTISLDSPINTQHYSLNNDPISLKYNRPTKSIEALSTSIYDPWWRREHWRYEIWEKFWSKGVLNVLLFRMAPGFWTFYLSSLVIIGLADYYLIDMWK